MSDRRERVGRGHSGHSRVSVCQPVSDSGRGDTLSLQLSSLAQKPIRPTSFSSQHTPTMLLASLPPEILSHIAFHLCLPDLAPPVPLLQTCRTIYNAIAPENDSRLYARIFRAAFDTAAPERRIGQLNAAHMCAELKLRSRSLRKIHRLIQAQNVSSLGLQDLWVLYLLLIENGTSSILPCLPQAGPQ